MAAAAATTDKWYRVDVRGWPMVKVSFKGVPATDQAYQSFLREMTALYHRQSKFTILFDTRNLGIPPKQFRQGLIDWVNNNHDKAKLYLDKSAVLVTNVVVRTFVDLVLRVARTASPVGVHGTLRDCAKFLEWDKLLAARKKKK